MEDELRESIRIKSMLSDDVSYISYVARRDVSLSRGDGRGKRFIALAKAELIGGLYVLTHSHMDGEELDDIGILKDKRPVWKFFGAGVFGREKKVSSADRRIREELEYSLKRFEGVDMEIKSVFNG